MEVQKGASGLAGTWTTSYQGAYTADIGYQASAADVKSKLSAVATVGDVDVSREVLGNSLKYTVTFTKNLGNLPLLQSVPYKFEEQTISTTERRGSESITCSVC